MVRPSLTLTFPSVESLVRVELGEPVVVFNFLSENVCYTFSARKVIQL